MYKIAINGASGRMGRALAAALEEFPDALLSAVLEHSEHHSLGNIIQSGDTQPPLRITADLQEALASSDVLLDFTRPAASMLALSFCRSQRRAMVVGTTGFDAKQYRSFEEAATDIPIVMAPNMSTGVNLCLRLLRLCAAALDSSYDVEISEIHHRHKLDAPSGTALAMGQAIAEGWDKTLAECRIENGSRKAGDKERDRHTIAFSSQRAGDFVGQHRVLFATSGEAVEITHQAFNRASFARGALRAALWVVKQPPGIYSMQDVLGLQGPSH